MRQCRGARQLLGGYEESCRWAGGTAEAEGWWWSFPNPNLAGHLPHGRKVDPMALRVACRGVHEVAKPALGRWARGRRLGTR